MKTFKQFINEIELNTYITKKDKLGLDLGSKFSPWEDDHKFPKLNDHTIYRRKTGPKNHQFITTNKNDKIVSVIHTDNFENKEHAHQVNSVASHKSNTLPLHKVYAHIIKHDRPIVSGSEQSEGGKKIWEKLSKERGIGLHGWHKGKAINLGNKLDHETEDETHTSDSRDTHTINTLLVAHKK